ncbi:RNA polymerase sigma factor [Pelosinus baikalensis]|uniref:Sigma-70 family RNA polymerase sigma factor n=1 Tax=Pelosinus baikalensis TaxID=2892015 RepID=A0ABS8HP59_9FIRM|nr:sigma-70 family RNA polymerase sigma factor [Pelosinus baikalensis]MCC5464727.1 sigma-70 family RNA polymerase sigma factor [Pelosinus baikalensis]
MGTALDFAPLVRKYTWNKSEDVRAEAWLAVVEATKLYDSTKGIPFAGFVKSRVKYSVWNMLRKQHRQWEHEVDLESNENNEENSLIDILSSGTNVSDEVEQIFLMEELREAINMLPERQRVAVIKTVVCNFSQTETAATLGVTPQAIYNLRNRGLARLKKKLERMYISESQYTGQNN